MIQANIFATSAAHRRAQGVWLLICCLLVYLMVVLGGATRLTGSGLSMVRWEPVSGILPPLGTEAWELEFESYKSSPEYQKKNIGMDLKGFKSIYWFEYSHRLLGRTVGLVFLLPFLYFLARRRLERRMIPKMLLMFLLGGFQGLLGWYMVKSGLVDDPHVSQYRLTAHLLAAVAIYGYIFWVALGLLRRPVGMSQGDPPWLRGALIAISVLVVITLATGGLVAGTRAGLVFNTFPLMGGSLVPSGYLAMEPVSINFFENVATIQFNHRLLAIATLVVVLFTAFFGIREARAVRLRQGLWLLLGIVSIQLAVGITVLLFYVPVSLAVVHQGLALLVFTVALYLTHRLSHP